jgi:hypothetical protein
MSLSLCFCISDLTPTRSHELLTDSTSHRYDKVNDRMEFPMKLNMTKFSDEGRPISKELKAAMGDDAREDDADGDNEEYEYELSGVVVHRGIFSSGHYYSYIKARKDNDDDDEEKEEEEGGKDEWFEFNDTRVTPFDSKKIPKICFGTSTSSSTEKLTIASCTNAFCLVYDRKRGRKKDRRSSPPQKIVDEVCKFNSALWRKRIVNESYFNFVHDLMEIDSEKQCEAVQIGIRILFGNELKEMNADAESKWFELLRKILSTSKEGCRVFSQLLLGGSTQLIRELLIYPRDKTVRYAGRLMLCVVKTLVVDDDSEDDSKVDEEKTDASLETLIEQHDLDDSKRSIAFRVARRAWLVCKEEPIRTLSRDTLRYALSIVAAYQGKLLNAGCLPTLLKIFERCMYSDEDEETESFLNLVMSCLYTYVSRVCFSHQFPYSPTQIHLYTGTLKVQMRMKHTPSLYLRLQDPYERVRCPRKYFDMFAEGERIVVVRPRSGSTRLCDLSIPCFVTKLHLLFVALESLQS